MKTRELENEYTVSCFVFYEGNEAIEWVAHYGDNDTVREVGGRLHEYIARALFELGSPFLKDVPYIRGGEPGPKDEAPEIEAYERKYQVGKYAPPDAGEE